MLYQVVRFYENFDIPNNVLKTGLTLEEAQEHCDDPETSSATAIRAAAMEHTKYYGNWFDGYVGEEA